MKNSCPVSLHASHETNSLSMDNGESSSRALTSEKINKFSEILLEVYRASYDDCMKILWNAVIYDPVADYCTKWLKRKHWSDYAAAPISIAEKDITSMCEVEIDNTRPEIVCFFNSFSWAFFLLCSLFFNQFFYLFLLCPFHMLIVFQVVIEPHQPFNCGSDFPPGFTNMDEMQVDETGTSDFVRFSF